MADIPPPSEERIRFAHLMDVLEKRMPGLSAEWLASLEAGAEHPAGENVTRLRWWPLGPELRRAEEAALALARGIARVVKARLQG